MAKRCSWGCFTVVPFLYPQLLAHRAGAVSHSALRCASRSQARSSSSTADTVNDLPQSRLNPSPDDYATPKFADKAQLALYAGRGGNGCVSFLREAYLPDGPPNGGDGGSGGNIYIQAAHGETSLHKLARRRFVRAGAGRHGQGSARSGTRGDDVIITVPVGTIVRELERHDPAADEEASLGHFRSLEKEWKRDQCRLEEERRIKLREKRDQEMEEQEEEEDGVGDDARRDAEHDREVEHEEEEDEGPRDPRMHKWLLYPGMSKGDMRATAFPRLRRRDRPLHQPPAPMYLDLSRPTEQPILLATGGIGGLGNPHFISRAQPRPMFATKGDEAVTMKIELELKLLADVGLVGLPNAGKSTLLRALTNSRTRVGSWAFTTLQPNVGTVVLDKYSGRPAVETTATSSTGDAAAAQPRTRFTVADIPGLIEGAHLDRGLGVAFLRHVERAGVLAFVIDLSAGDAVAALGALWREVGLYARMRDEDERARDAASRIDWSLNSSPSPNGSAADLLNADLGGSFAASKHIARKPWFVVATKADLPETQEKFRQLKSYLDSISRAEASHPSGIDGAWTSKCAVIPVSAINGQGVDRIVHWVAGLLKL